MDALLSRAHEVGLMLDPSTAQRVWAYFELLRKWNAKMNLTGLTVTPDGAGAIERLLIEPMLAAAHAGPARTMVDVGSGGGSPAIPFALAAASNPRLTMVEARERKSVFLREALRETGLTGQVRTAKFEAVAAEPAAAGAFDSGDHPRGAAGPSTASECGRGPRPWRATVLLPRMRGRTHGRSSGPSLGKFPRARPHTEELRNDRDQVLTVPLFHVKHHACRRTVSRETLLAKT